MPIAILPSILEVHSESNFSLFQAVPAKSWQFPSDSILENKPIRSRAFVGDSGMLSIRALERRAVFRPVSLQNPAWSQPKAILRTALLAAVAVHLLSAVDPVPDCGPSSAATAQTDREHCRTAQRSATVAEKRPAPLLQPLSLVAECAGRAHTPGGNGDRRVLQRRPRLVEVAGARASRQGTLRQYPRV